MTLREKIAKVMWICGAEWQMRGDAHDLNLFTADAILAAIREHMTSPEAVERGVDAAFKMSGAFGPEKKIRSAILAALGGSNE